MQLWEESGRPTNPEEAITFMGQSFYEDPEYIQRIRQLYNCDVDAYLKQLKFDKDKTADKQMKKAQEVSGEDVVKRVPPVESTSGGTEFGTGKVIQKGALGDVPMPV